MERAARGAAAAARGAITRTTGRQIGRLRVGYVSPDWAGHPVARFMQPILESHDRDAFEIHVYDDTPRPDAFTDRLRPLAHAWHRVRGMPDDALAEKIRADGIDVLVDLAGHTAGNRLLVFARRPAPVQVSYLGYANTTGLDAIDYRLTDAVADPPGLADELHSREADPPAGDVPGRSARRWRRRTWPSRRC